MFKYIFAIAIVVVVVASSILKIKFVQIKKFPFEM